MEQLSLPGFETDENKRDKIEIPVDDRISGSKAMQMLALSRHTFEKVVKEELIKQYTDGKKKYYSTTELEKFMSTEAYKQLAEGTVDKRNNLNDLTGKDWLPETKSFFYQKGLGADSPEAQIEKLHPAPYSFQDIGHLIRFFTKKIFFLIYMYYENTIYPNFIFLNLYS